MIEHIKALYKKISEGNISKEQVQKELIDIKEKLSEQKDKILSDSEFSQQLTKELKILHKKIKQNKDLKNLKKVTAELVNSIPFSKEIYLKDWLVNLINKIYAYKILFISIVLLFTIAGGLMYKYVFNSVKVYRYATTGLLNQLKNERNTDIILFYLKNISSHFYPNVDSIWIKQNLNLTSEEIQKINHLYAYSATEKKLNNSQYINVVITTTDTSVAKKLFKNISYYINNISYLKQLYAKQQQIVNNYIKSLHGIVDLTVNMQNNSSDTQRGINIYSQPPNFSDFITSLKDLNSLIYSFKMNLNYPIFFYITDATVLKKVTLLKTLFISFILGVVFALLLIANLKDKK